MTTIQRRIFIFGALGYFKLGALMEGMSYKLALHVLVTFIEQVVLIHKHITLFINSSISTTKRVTMTLTKSQRWNYMTSLTTLPLHICWVPHWPREIWKMDSGVLFHTLYVTITNSQRNKTECSSSFTSILRDLSSKFYLLYVAYYTAGVGK